jgi:hypothetical protein
MYSNTHPSPSKVALFSPLGPRTEANVVPESTALFKTFTATIYV